MMYKLLCLMACSFLTLLQPINAHNKDKNPQIYKIYDGKGHEVSYDGMIIQLLNGNIILFGELHNCPIAHWLEYKVAQSLYELKNGKKMIMGAEMFESDVQTILDEYMQGLITGERFEQEARIWPNYTTDYEPFVSFAKEKQIPFIATNVPRRYANMVSKKGLQALDSLSQEAKKHLPPRPIPFKADSIKSKAFGIMAGIIHKRETTNPQYMLEAQALKDAMMAYNIISHPADIFLHIQGNYHSNNYEGICEFLRHYKPGVRLQTITTVRQEAINRLEPEHLGLADFIICVTQDMTYTY